MEQPTRTHEILEGIIIKEIEEQKNNNKLFLTRLNITTEELNSVLEIIYNHTPNIMNLGLRSNWIKSIPKSITLLKHLRYLDLTNNYITYIPSFISELNQLNYLGLSANRLTSIEYESLMGCESLTCLQVISNRNLTYIGMRIFDLSKLLCIYAHDTKLSREYFCDLEKYLMTSTSMTKIDLTFDKYPFQPS